jgi:hypothetical protein
LRALASSYEGIGICKQVWFDVVSRLQPKVGFLPNIIPDGESDQDPKWRTIAAPAEEFLLHPDRTMPMNEWLIASVNDVLDLGQSPIYVQRNRMGDVIALELIDGALIKPLLDDRGRVPQPPYPAYQQFVYGMPAGLYTSEQVIMIRERPRTQSAYSLSRVELALLRINQALRKEGLDLTRFTDGAVPEGFLSLNANTQWTTEEIETYEQVLNGLMGGNDTQRVHMKVLPPDVAQFTQTRQSDPHLDLDQYILNVIVAAFGLTMDEIAFTGTSNRSVGQTQEAVIYRRVVQPLAQRYGVLFTNIIQQQFDPRLVVSWGGVDESEDLMNKAQTLDIGVKNGSLSPSRMARMMGWPVDIEVPPMIVTKDGPIWLEDALNLRQAQMDAKLAGLQFAISTPSQAAPPTSPPAPPSSATPPPAKPTKTPPPDDAEEDDPSDAQRALQTEYRRWVTVATRAVKAGKAVPPFQSTVIPLAEQRVLRPFLDRCQTPDEVRAVFKAHKLGHLVLGAVPPQAHGLDALQAQTAARLHTLLMGAAANGPG